MGESPCWAIGCPNKAKWIVNARFRQAQSPVCGLHLARLVDEMEHFDDSRYPLRARDLGVRVYPVPAYPL